LFSKHGGERALEEKGQLLASNKVGKENSERGTCRVHQSGWGRCYGVGADVSFFQVYLKARAEGSANHEEHVSQLKSEVRHIQEVSKTPGGSGCIATPCCAELCCAALANWLNSPVC